MNEIMEYNDINREDEQREANREQSDRRYRDKNRWCEIHNTYYSAMWDLCPDCMAKEQKKNDFFRGLVMAVTMSLILYIILYGVFC